MHFQQSFHILRAGQLVDYKPPQPVKSHLVNVSLRHFPYKTRALDALLINMAKEVQQILLIEFSCRKNRVRFFNSSHITEYEDR
jgi:hypothetical protein